MSASACGDRSAWTAFAMHWDGVTTTPSESCPLAPLIEETVALNITLGNRRFPLARHHARILWVRAARMEIPEAQTAALELLLVLDGAIRPDLAAWRPLLMTLNRAVDQALDATPFD